MTLYFFKMMACSVAFYALYAFVFQNRKMLVFNRFYLLGSILLAFVIPLIPIPVEKQGAVLYGDQYPEAVAGVTPQYTGSDQLLYWGSVIGVLVSFVLLVRFIKNLVRFSRHRAGCQSIEISGAKIALVADSTMPYSFFNTIFLNKSAYEQGHIEKEVLAHELAHVNQRHSWDIILMELLQVFCWFHPMIYLYKRSIKINHELLADAAVIKQFDNVHNYQCILLQRAGVNAAWSMASSFNFFITKKRLIMLQKSFNKQKTTWLAFTVLPLLVTLIFSFCNRVEKRSVPEESKIAGATESQPSSQQANSSGSSVALTGEGPSTGQSADTSIKTFPPPKVVRVTPEGPGATAAELAEYEAIVTEMKVGDNRYREIKGKSDRVYPIYEKMTAAQRTDASQLPPPPPPAPTVTIKKFPPPKVKEKVVTPPQPLHP